MEIQYREPELSHIITLDGNHSAITNCNSLSLAIGEHSEATIIKSVGELIKKACLYLKVKTGKHYDCKYVVNIPRNREGTSLCFGYCWVDNPLVYNILIGKNEDGTERIERVVETPSDVSRDAPIIPIDLDGSWDFRDPLSDQQTGTKLAPIVGRYWCKYGPAEIKSAKERAAKIGKVVDIPEGSLIGVSPGIIYPVAEGFEPNILFADRVPKWVTAKMIEDKIRPFIPGGVKLTTTISSAGNPRGSGTVTIQFTPGNNKDAAFALQMVKKLVFPSKGKGKDCMLILNHSIREYEDDEY